MYSNGLNPTYILPSRATVSRMLPNKFEEVLERVNGDLAKISYLTLTTGMWTSTMKTESYIAITAHFVNKEWQLKKVLVECSRFVGPHCGNDIKLAILTICNRFNISQKVQAIVTDKLQSDL